MSSETIISIPEKAILHVLNTEISNKKFKLGVLEEKLHKLEHEINFIKTRIELDEQMKFQLLGHLR